MAGPIRQRLRDRFPIIARVIDGTRKVVIGTAEAKPVDQTMEAAIGLPFLALIRKAVASLVGWLIAAIYAAINWDLAFLNAELTELIVALVIQFYIVWRVPNAPKTAG